MQECDSDGAWVHRPVAQVTTRTPSDLAWCWLVFPCNARWSSTTYLFCFQIIAETTYNVKESVPPPAFLISGRPRLVRTSLDFELPDLIMLYIQDYTYAFALYTFRVNAHQLLILQSNLARLNLPHPEAVFEIGFFRRNPVPCKSYLFTDIY